MTEGEGLDWKKRRRRKMKDVSATDSGLPERESNKKKKVVSGERTAGS